MRENHDFVVPVYILTWFVHALFSWGARHTTVCLNLTRPQQDKLIFHNSLPHEVATSSNLLNFETHFLYDGTVFVSEILKRLVFVINAPSISTFRNRLCMSVLDRIRI